MQQNVMQFNKKSDLVASYGISEGEMSYNLGYAFTNNVAFITSYREFSPRFHEFFFDNELSLFKLTPQKIFFSCNIGYGIGAINDPGYNYSIVANRKFLLPAFGYKSKFFDIGLSTRISRINYLVHIDNDYYFYEASEEYYNLHKEALGSEYTDYYDFKESQIRNHLSIEDVGKKPFYFLEPAVTIGVGYKNIKFQYQYVLCNKLNSGEIAYIDKAYHFSLRITCNINDSNDYIHTYFNNTSKTNP